MIMKRNPLISGDPFLRLSPELRLVLRCLSQDNRRVTPSNVRNSLTDMDWERFLQLSDQHCVGPLILQTIQRGTSPELPERVGETLAVQHKNNIFISMSLSDALCRVAQRFQRAGISMISLKGPALAQTLFNDTSLRLSSDLDILVPLDDLDAVEVLLKNMGYRSIGKNRSLTERQKKLLQSVHHHRTFVHSETRINLEVHWRLSRLESRFLTKHPFDHLWQRADRILIHDIPVPVLGPTDNFRYLCIHGACHQWSRLSWLFDIHEILKKRPIVKIKEILCRPGSSTADDVLGQTLVLLDRLFDTDYTSRCQNGFDLGRAIKLAAMVIPFLETSETAKEATLFSDHMYRIIVYMFALLKTNALRLQYVKGLLMPTDLEIQTLAIPDGLFPLYFLSHPVCTVYRSVAKAVGLKDPFGSSLENI